MKSILAIFLTVCLGCIEGSCFASDSLKDKGNLKKEAFTPEKILPTGVDSSISTNPYTGEAGYARKGTVAATLNNVVLLNTLLLEVPSPNNQKAIQELIDAIASLLPSLRVIGVFDLFSLEEWIATDTQPGRILAAALYLQKYPQNITPAIKQRLVQLQKQVKSKVVIDALERIINNAA